MSFVCTDQVLNPDCPVIKQMFQLLGHNTGIGGTIVVCRSRGDKKVPICDIVDILLNTGMTIKHAMFKEQRPKFQDKFEYFQKK